MLVLVVKRSDALDDMTEEIEMLKARGNGQQQQTTPTRHDRDQSRERANKMRQNLSHIERHARSDRTR
jgi:FtsZ-binding cell division protein ZapB